jgi:F-type H+-transporting ATPase subunit delta
MISVVGMRYAKALIEVIATDQKRDPKMALEELRAVSAMITESQPLHIALLSPAVSPTRKRAVMAKLMLPIGVSESVRNFVFVVIDHRRVSEFPSIIEAFDRLLDERLGFARGSVQSATELSAAQKTALEAEMSRLSGKIAKLDYAIDPALIGGVVARIGATVYDGSVKGQLEKLRLKLAAGA